MKEVLIIPIGRIDPDILEAISSGLSDSFHCRTRIGGEIPIPENLYSYRRKQYHSSGILKEMEIFKKAAIDAVLGVTEVDLYIPELNFVFGEADLYSSVAVISLARLRQDFYGLRPDMDLFKERAIKEAIHEIGHTCGLGHCRNPKCIMHFSNCIEDTDIKGPGFCNLCRIKVGL
jgi:archaemetzincin